MSNAPKETVDQETGEITEPPVWTGPTCLNDCYDQLIAPFHPSQCDVKPTNIREGKAMALIFADPRVYQERLDNVVGPDNWEVRFERQVDGSYMCLLRVFGVLKCDISDPKTNSKARGRGAANTNDDDPGDGGNANTTGVAQAFKRACAMFGVGRYLYEFGNTKYEMNGRYFKMRNWEIVQDMYRKANIKF